MSLFLLAPFLLVIEGVLWFLSLQVDQIDKMVTDRLEGLLLANPKPRESAPTIGS